MKRQGSVGDVIELDDCYARQIGKRIYIALKPRGKAWASVYLNFEKGTRSWGRVKTRKRLAESWLDEKVKNNHPHEQRSGPIEELN
jgi:hypothetical protein